MPPLYLAWFKKYFPRVKIQGNGPYVLQCLKQVQEMKDTGRKFYQLIKAIFAEIGVHPTSVDGGFYAFAYKQKYLVFVCSETDDFLISTDSNKAFGFIQNKMKEEFGISLQTGIRINYLNFKLIQSEHGISMDQTDHILCMVDLYFGPKYITRRTDTPLRTDKQFEIEISNDIPATTSELKSLVQKYNGSYLSIYGAISHVTTASLPDLCNAMSRLGFFQAAPSKLGFESLHRLMMYLKTYPNVPFFYPNKPLTSTLMF
jgi:hypothetical protein